MPQVQTRGTASYVGPKWTAALAASFVAGLVFIVLEMVGLRLFAGMSLWAFPRMIAALVLEQGVLPATDAFDITMFLIAMFIHFSYSILLGFVICWAIWRRPMGISLAIGTGIGLAIYLVDFYVFTQVLHWFIDARNWVTLVNHLIFGFVLALTYKKLQPHSPVV